MPVPQQVTDWMKRNYPRPRVDSEWLEACYNWIITDLHLSPATDMPRILQNVETQFLFSDLRDSTVPNTGLSDPLVALGEGQTRVKLKGPSVLVEITAISDIGVSAFALKTARQTRIDKQDLNDLADQDNDGEEGEREKIPKYPRGMLRFEVSDGSKSVRAVEFRRMPELELGNTPLGYKLLLRNTLATPTTLYMEPNTVILKGHKTEDREHLQDRDLVRGLALRMGLPVEPEPDSDVQVREGADNEQNALQDAPVPAFNDPPEPPQPRPRAQLERPLAAASPNASRPIAGPIRKLGQPVSQRPALRILKDESKIEDTKPTVSPYFAAETPERGRSTRASGTEHKLKAELPRSPSRKALLLDGVDEGFAFTFSSPSPIGAKIKKDIESRTTKPTRVKGEESDFDTSFDDQDFDFGNPELLAALDKVERSQTESIRTQTAPSTSHLAQSLTRGASSAARSRAAPSDEDEVISIPSSSEDEDSEAENKENQMPPAPYRRSRTLPSQENEVIELSD